MNREIKFRAWDGERMLEDPRIPDYCSGLNGYFWGSTLVFMQYTGLKDADGREIYEGDFVEVFLHGKYQKAHIEAARGGFVIVPKLRSEVRLDWLGDHVDVTHRNFVGRVVGNIYETPMIAA